VRTHYDNLQVSRSASDRVIRAAYKSLSQQWHPDKHPDDPETAERISKIINEAYRVLSDPELREKHDKWIADQEGVEHRTHTNGEPKEEKKQSGQKNKQRHPYKQKGECEHDGTEKRTESQSTTKLKGLASRFGSNASLTIKYLFYSLAGLFLFFLALSCLALAVHKYVDGHYIAAVVYSFLLAGSAYGFSKLNTITKNMQQK
jgi:curved DNA-binding protein CbpA